MSNKTIYILKLASLLTPILGLVIIVMARPWEPSWGPGYSVQRIGLYTLSVILMIFVPACFLSYTYAKQKALRENIEDLITVRELSASAVAAAIYAVGGFLTGINIDLPALITAFTAVFYGPLVSLTAFSIGFIIRWLIGGAPWLSIPILVPVIAMVDGGVWAINSYVYHLIRNLFGEKNIFLRLALAIGLIIVIHFACEPVLYGIVMLPWPASIAYITYAALSWYPTAIIFTIVGVIAGESLSRAKPMFRI